MERKTSAPVLRLRNRLKCLVNRAGVDFRALLFLALVPFSAPHSALLAAESLSSKSPFLPPGHGVKPPEPPKPVVEVQGPISREIEFRGIVEIDGIYKFSIFNKKDQKSYWLTENEAAASGITAKSYDAASATIMIEMNNRTERLTLMSATDSPMPVTQATPAAANPVLPPELNTQNPPTKTNNRRSVPRRRVILPKKTN